MPQAFIAIVVPIGGRGDTMQQIDEEEAVDLLTNGRLDDKRTIDAARSLQPKCRDLSNEDVRSVLRDIRQRLVTSTGKPTSDTEFDGDLAKACLSSILARLFPKDGARRQKVVEWLCEQRRTLLGAEPTPIEIFVVENMLIHAAKRFAYEILLGDAVSNPEAALLMTSSKASRKGALAGAKLLTLVRRVGAKEMPATVSRVKRPAVPEVGKDVGGSHVRS
jgi:hypothetical protein